MNKFELEIDAAEKALREQLLRLLPGAAKSGANIFTTDLLRVARECVYLRERQGVPVIGSVGYLFLAASEENASKDEHRRGPRRLAEALLAQLS